MKRNKALNISGGTGVFAVIGYPIEHSLSPAMHNAAIGKLGIDCVYVPFRVVPGELRMAVEGFRAAGIRGLNVTIPHKQRIMNYLDSVDGLARRIGAVNTVVNRKGKLAGYNTDAYGFLKPLRKLRRLGNSTVFVFGAGGAARAIVYSLLTQKVGRIYITDRDNARAARLAREMKTRKAVYVKYDNSTVRDIAGKADILVNATNTGMSRGDPLLIDPRCLKKGALVYDIVYNRETELVKKARARGIKCLDGVDMFVNQGAVSLEYWTGRKAPLDVMYRVVRNKLRKERR